MTTRMLPATQERSAILAMYAALAATGLFLLGTGVSRADLLVKDGSGDAASPSHAVLARCSPEP